MMGRCAIAACALLMQVFGAVSQMLAAFETATSSSAYATDGFSADLAVSPGSGYWCSAGGHSANQIVSWTGYAGSRVPAVGIQISWAYAPGEVKVLVSGDGGNFEEAACWKQSIRQDVAYTETIFFNAPTNTKAVKLLMRSPMPWGYFGITSAELLVKAFPFMLVSANAGATEECLVSTPQGLALQSCLAAIAAADGREVWSLSDAGQLFTLHKQCVTLAGGDVSAGGQVVLEPCDRGSENGASKWGMSSNGQLKLSAGGDFCLGVNAAGGRVSSCADAASSTQFMQVAVEEFDPSFSAAAKNAASLLQAAVARQQRLLLQLQTAASKCSLGHLLGGVANVSSLVSLSAVSLERAANDDSHDVVASLFREELVPAQQTIELSARAVKTLQAQVA